MQTFAIIPAAGRSQRMGQPKLLLPWGDSTVIEIVVAAWRNSGVQHTIAVVHPDDELLAERCAAAGALVVRAAEPPPEMKDSIRLGLAKAAEFAPQAHDAWLLSPADLPTLDPAVVARVLKAYSESVEQPGSPQIWVPRCGAKRGHPVVFSWALASEVSRLAAHEGVNALLGRHAVGFVDVDEQALGEDLDTPEDYERLRRRE